MNLKLNLIAAACENMGIGKNGDLPWRLKSEMAYFTKMTTKTLDPSKKNAVIMGRVTWDCIPLKFRPLKDRLNVILTHRTSFEVDEGVLTFPSLRSAVETLGSSEYVDSIENVWVIGGSHVYKTAMESDYRCRLYLTNILKEFDCDTFFPKIPESFVKIRDPEVLEEIQEENGIRFRYDVFEKA